MATSQAAHAAETTSATNAPGFLEQSIRIDVRGAVAHVTVNRHLACATSSQSLAGPPDAAPNDNSNDNKDAPTDTILDVALPDRSALLGVELNDGGGFLPTRPLAASKARDAYVESLRAVGLVATKAPFEEEVRFRIRVACHSVKPNNNILLRYNFSTLLELSGDRARIAFPAAPERVAPRARVEVHLDPPDVAAEIVISGVPHRVPMAGTSMAFDFVSQRSRWIVSFGPVSRASSLATLATLTSVGTPATGPTILAYSIGARPAPRQQLPARVLFMLDRSRSVGPSGLEAERNLARGILEAMPPSTRFDALLFDREPKRLFPVARAATQDAIRALEEQMSPALLANGTDLGAVLRAAGDLIRRETSDFSPRTLLILLSDGAIGAPPGGANLATFPNLAAFLGSLVGVDLMTAVISVRVHDDPEVSPDERSILRRLAAAASGGGVERAIRIKEIPDAIPAILEALRAGGDVHSVEMARRAPSSGTIASRGSGADSGIVEVIPPGEGATGILALPPHEPVTDRAMLTYRGLRRPSKLRPVRVDPRWLEPLLHGATIETQLMVGPALAVLVEPVVRSQGPEAAAPSEARGYLERSVVRDALSLAFTPRARACYLNRTARTRAERDLTGRVRLALDLVRGEVGGARIVASTLGHTAIENCLRESAYALEIPRAYRNDDPVTAVLNLVFRPRTPERHNPDAENSNLGHELDVVIEAALKGMVDQEKPLPAGAPRVGRAPESLER